MFSRTIHRTRWYIKECLKICGAGILYQVALLGTVIIVTHCRYDVVWQGLLVLITHFVLYGLWLFAMVMLVNKESVVEARIVQTGQNIGDQVLVTEGLSEGEQVIVAGLQKIKPGVSVKAVAGVASNAIQSPASAPTAVAKTE